MSIFNPQVPDSRDPNLPNIRPIGDIPANQSGKTFLDTIGSGIKDAVDLVDTSIKKSIHDKAYAGVDPQRDQFTASLEKIKSGLDNDAAASVVPAPVQKVAGVTTGNSLLDANAMASDDDIPEGLSSGLDRINQLAAAKAAGSVKLNDTQYAMETLSVAKQLRAQYGTGYRDYIDSEVSKASGLPVANSYYQNLLTDINRQLNQKAQTKDEIGNLMLKNMNVPGIASELAARRTTGQGKMSDADVYQQIGAFQTLQTQYQIDAAQRAKTDATKADAVDDVVRKSGATFSQDVNLGMRGITASAGVPTAGALSQYLTDVQLGRHPEATQDEINQRVMQLDAYTAQQKAALWAKGTEGGDNSILAKVGSKKLQEMVDSAVTPMTVFSQMAKDKDSGAAFMVAHQNDAILNQDKKNVLINNDTGPAARQYQAMRSILGDGAFPDYMKSVAQNSAGFKDPLSTRFTQEALLAIEPIRNMFGEPIGPPRTMFDAVKSAKEVDANGTPVPPEYFGKTIQRVEQLTNPKYPMEVKDKLVQYSFSPKNIGLLDELNKDYKDPKTGQWVPGQYAAFNILSAPKITNAVAETAKAHPENYAMYQDTLEQQFGKLYRSSLQTLNSSLAKSIKTVNTDESGNPISGTTPLDAKVTAKKVPSWGFSFNSENNNFGLVDNNNRPITKENFSRRPDFAAVGSVLDELENVNKGVSNLAYVHQHNPNGNGDTPQYLLRTLQSAVRGPFGYTEGSPLQGATEGMMKAVIKAQAPEMTPQDLANKVLQGNLSDQPIDAPVRTR